MIYKFKGLVIEDMGNHYVCTHPNGATIKFIYAGPPSEFLSGSLIKDRLKHFAEHGTMEGY